jgi:hypothetical protein
MKAIKYLAFVSSLIIGASACQPDLLNTSPYNAVGSTNMWTSENLATLAVNGVYNTFLQSSGEVENSVTGGNYLGLEVYLFAALDPTVSARNNWSSTLHLLNGNATPSNTEFSRAWKQHYEGISRANDVIDNVGNVPGMSQELSAQYMAEAKFLRAYFYYRLNCLYRGVPLYLTTTPVSEFNKPRNTEAEVWEAIINDLTDVINEPNIPGRYVAGDPNYGRATKGAAYALRGKTYLWMNEYKLAEQDFKEVLKMGYSLFEGGYKELFKDANEQCPEMIFSIQCYEQDGYGNQMPFKYGSRVTYPGGWNDFYGDTDFIDTYETKEGKPFNWDDFIPGYSKMSAKARSVYFLRDGLNSGNGNFGSGNYRSLKTKMQDYGADFSKYLDQGNEARIRKVYEDRDPRLMQTYITPYSDYLGSPHTAGGAEFTYTLRWPFIENDIEAPFDLRTDTKKVFHYLVRKFVSEGTEHLDRGYSPIDVPLIRYADVLLSLAEALNEQNKTAEAATYVNMVRKRAGIALLNSNSYTTVAGQEDMRNRIRREKRWELACEGTLYFDELRWGTWYDVKLYEGAGLKECWGQNVVTWTKNGDHYTTWPIPATERQLNTSLDQNYGWAD